MGTYAYIPAPSHLDGDGSRQVNPDGSTVFMPDPRGPHKAAVRVEATRWMVPRLLEREKTQA